MDDATRKAFFINTLLVANADGEIDPAERAFLRTFMERAGISASEAEDWMAELRSGEARFAPIEDRERADEALGLMVAVASADGELGPTEREALLAWARVVGLSAAELREKVRACWGADALEHVFPGAEAQAPVHGEPAARILVLTEDFEQADAFMEISTGFDFDVGTSSRDPDLPREPDFVVFHVAEERLVSLETLARLRRRWPRAHTVAVTNRHQAFQISYLLEAEVSRCMVEPIYPGELRKIVDLARGG